MRVHVCPGVPECSRPTAGEEDGRESFAPSEVESRTLAVSPTNMNLGNQTWSLARVGRRCMLANLQRIEVPVVSLSNILKAPG